MSSEITVSSVPRIHSRLTDVKHSKAVVLLDLPTGHGVAIAVVETDGGSVLAWDAFDDSPGRPANPKAIVDLDWADWDDMPSKLIFREANSAWLASLGLWLLPEYSIAREAAELVADWSDSDTTDERRRYLQTSPVVAYLPIVDEDVFARALSKH